MAYIDIASVNRESKQIEEVSEIYAHEAPSRARQLVKDGDVLVSTVRPNLNAVAQVNYSIDSATASTGFTVLRPKTNQLDSRYLYYWVRSPYFVEDMTRQSTGASYPAVSDSIVKKYFIPLPPLDEQRRIAAILDKADAVRRKRQSAIALTEDLLRSAFLEMFGDPVTNPKGWKVAPLEDFCLIQSGIAKGKKVDSSKTVSVPYMRVANVQDGYLDLSEIKEISVLPSDIDRYALKTGDVLLTEGGDPDKLGRGAIWNGEVQTCIHQNHIFCVRPDVFIAEPGYLSAHIGSERGKRFFLRAAKQTTGIATINKTQLKSFPALLPPRQLQIDYLNFAKKLRFVSSRLKEHLTQSDNFFNSLLQRAFQGDL
ncbi:restriction endonuclease subunit S [Romeria aff. gracilis LEGE 07310]|uniref:Restriction endonuclease subunit S n=1 Tax=Vasconcelosia minhoensis LEGE 07310 TaxID=915328 RepID=A0A8J7AG92_9CYAN|nr:restriction endonuclease subunit S [Romeria gracilis]MBE9078284.1 restriction endonuclease subunit S [Romeria aff. gracilis LEGE 07310]